MSWKHNKKDEYSKNFEKEREKEEREELEKRRQAARLEIARSEMQRRAHADKMAEKLRTPEQQRQLNESHAKLRRDIEERRRAEYEAEQKKKRDAERKRLERSTKDPMLRNFLALGSSGSNASTSADRGPPPFRGNCGSYSFGKSLGLPNGGFTGPIGKIYKETKVEPTTVSYYCRGEKGTVKVDNSYPPALRQLHIIRSIDEDYKRKVAAKEAISGPSPESSTFSARASAALSKAFTSTPGALAAAAATSRYSSYRRDNERKK